MRRYRQTIFSDLIPTTGFIPEYVTAAKRLCDAPLLYHLGAILPCLAAIVCPCCVGLASDSGRTKKEPLFLWVMLLGESGSRKTQAMIKAAAVVVGDPENPQCGPGPLARRSRSALGSRAGLVAMLQAEPCAFVTIEELAPWIRSHRAAYAQDGAQTWCEVFDGRIRDSNLRDNVKANAAQKDEPPIRVSFIAGGATPSVMRATRNDPEIWNSGLFARVMILAADPPEERPGPFSWSEKMLLRLRARLMSIAKSAKAAGAVAVDQDARQLWNDWLLDRSSRNRGLYETHAILLRRLPAFAFRIACLYALSRGSLRATLDDMGRALRLADVSVDCVLSLDLR